MQGHARLLFGAALAIGLWLVLPIDAAARPRVSCATLDGLLARPGAGQGALVQMQPVAVVTVQPNDSSWQVGLRVEQHEGEPALIPLRWLSPSRLASAVVLACPGDASGPGRAWSFVSASGEAPRQRQGSSAAGGVAAPAHGWGSLLVASESRSSAAPVPELLRWVGAMHQTDDHMRARSRAERGTAPLGLAIVLPIEAAQGAGGAAVAAEAARMLRGCSLQAAAAGDPSVANGSTVARASLIMLPASLAGPTVDRRPAGLRNASSAAGMGDAAGAPDSWSVDCGGVDEAWTHESAVVVAEEADANAGESFLQTSARTEAAAGAAAAHSTGLPGTAADADGWGGVSLVELHANARARSIPMVKQIMDPVVNEAMNKIANPLVNQLMPAGGGETGPETANEALPSQTDGDLGAMIAVRLKAEVMNVAADALSHRLGSTLSAALTKSLGSHLLAVLPTDDVGGAEAAVGAAARLLESSLPAAASAEVTPRLYNALFPALLKAVALATSHTVVPALAAGLQPLRGAPAEAPQDGTPQRRAHCDACLRAYLDARHLIAKGDAEAEPEPSPETLRHCRLCFSPQGLESDMMAYHALHLTHWYGEYYAEYWRLAAEEYLKKRAPHTEGPYSRQRHAEHHTAARGAELESKE